MMNYLEPYGNISEKKERGGKEGERGWGCNWQDGWNMISNRCQNLTHGWYSLLKLK
jgi:hypothetical protein